MRDMIKTLFFPPFLRQIDEKLLVERPSLWATRLHRVAWPALLLVLLSLGLGMLTPTMRPYAINQFISLGTVGIVLAQIGLLIYWLYGQDAYNIEREHGISRDRSGWREFGTYLGALGMISVSLFLFLATVRHRAQTVNNDQFARDLFLITLVRDMENRDGHFHVRFRDELEEIMPYHEQDYSGLAVEQLRENEALEREFRRLIGLRSTYEGYLGRAAAYFNSDTPDSRDALLEKYVLDPYRTEDGEIRWSDENDYWSSDHYLSENLEMADLIPLQAEWARGDYSTLFDVLSRYSGTPVEKLELDWEKWQQADQDNDSRGYSSELKNTYKAWSTTYTILDFAFNPTVKLALMFWAIVGAIAVHLSLLRFTFKHSGLKGFIFLVLSVVGVVFIAGLYLFIGEMIQSRVGYSGYSDYYMEKHMSVGMGIILLATAAIFAYTRTLSRRSSFTWKMAISIYILPLLLAVSPYMMLGIEELVTYTVNDTYWFSTHFMDDPAYFNEFSGFRGKETWSFAPLGWYILYFAQFAYVPSLGWLKRSHTRLMSLPR